MNATLPPVSAACRAPEDLLAEWDAKARRFETPCGEGRMVWRAWGEGPPVLLLHGSHGAWSHWIRNLDALAVDRTVWAPDLPGFGDSDMPPSLESGQAYIEPLAAGLRSLLGEAPAVPVVGFSFGGVMGAELAAACPELVGRLILVDTGGLGTPQGDIRLTRVRGLQGAERRAAMTANLLGMMIHAPESVDELALHLQGLNPPRGRAAIQYLVLPDKLLHSLPKVRARVDAIWGEFDRPHPDPDLQAAVLRTVKPDLELRVIASAGHWSMYEGAEQFNIVVRELLDR
jgi:pimeloyl-ACP methyl ester carboxylesterase